MMYDAIERAATVFEANFAADMAALISAKGVGGLGIESTVNVHKRRDAQTIASLNLKTPGLGIYPNIVATQMKRQDHRDNVNSLYVDYVYQTAGDNPDEVAIAVELAAEAILKSIDRMPKASSELVIGAGVPLSSVTVSFGRLSHLEGQDTYEDMVTVEFPVIDRDQV